MGVKFIDIVELILWVIFVDFIFCGMVIASAMWFICNKVLKLEIILMIFHDLHLKNNIKLQKYLLLSPLSSTNELEWAYCFDVHLNAFFAVFTILHLAQDTGFIRSNHT